MDCPAGLMWADVLTKSLQGTEYRKMRAQLMNCAMEYKDKEESTTKKRKTLIVSFLTTRLRNHTKRTRENLKER